MNYFQLLLAPGLLGGIGPSLFFSRDGLPEFDGLADEPREFVQQPFAVGPFLGPKR